MPETRSSLLNLLVDPTNAEAWEEFVSLYRPILMAFLRKRGLGEEEAEEFVQDILVQLLDNFSKFKLDRSRGRFRTWLFKVALNAIATRFRAEGRRKRAEGHHERLLIAELLDSRRLELEWNRLHREKVLTRALEIIRSDTRPKTWACFQGLLLEDRPGSEVAAELDIAVNAVYVNSHRVLEKIRRWCADHLEEIVDDDPDRMPAG